MNTWQQLLHSIHRQEDSSVNLHLLSGWVHTFVGWVLYEWSDLEAAETHLQHGVEAALAIHSDIVHFYSQQKLAVARFALGDADGADRSMRDLTQWEAFFPQLQSAILAWQVRYWLLRGDLESARRWAHESDLSVHDEPEFPRCVFEYYIFVLTPDPRRTGAFSPPGGGMIRAAAPV